MSGTGNLHDRMVRDAIAELLRGRASKVAVDRERAAVEVRLPAGWGDAPVDLVTSVARCLVSVPEVQSFELTVLWARDQSANKKGAAMATDQQLNAIDRYITDVWGKGDLDAIDEIFTADRVRHGPDFEGTHEGAAGQKEIVTLYRTSTPDLVVSVEAQVREGDLVVTRWRATGTSLGATLGVPPTGTSGDVWGFFMHRFEGDKIAEEWTAFDSHALLQLLGVSMS
jgi:steroid delta-isomerase-like uncharacterized protein